tara:strand:+ start:251 stop:490 length:240 start_codon:yes stop_codon:yes gene_type:complete
MDERFTGKIVKYIKSREHEGKTTGGYGFIQQDGNDKQIFFHCTQYYSHSCPIEGERVTFKICEQKDGRTMAVHVEVNNE